MSTLVAINLNQHVARIKHPRRLDSFVAAHLDYGFRRHEDLGNRTFQIGARDPSFQAFANLFLVSGISMKYEPLLHLRIYFNPPATYANGQSKTPTRDRRQTG